MIRKIVAESEHGPIVRVEFSLPGSIWADRINLLGDFNNWDRDRHAMQRLRDGGWYITLDLAPGRVYQFRYLCDGEHWMNDTQADAYVPNSYGSHNCVVSTDVSPGQLPDPAGD